jgi:hypothetical protein
MTYKELLEELKTLSTKELNQDARVYLMEVDDLVPIEFVCTYVRDKEDIGNKDKGSIVLAS